jgi:anaerobic selenocysteine-containing dehydrogenase
MTDMLRRRDFLKSSTAFAATMAAGFGCIEIASAAPIQAPTISACAGGQQLRSLRATNPGCRRHRCGAAAHGCEGQLAQ